MKKNSRSSQVTPSERGHSSGLGGSDFYSSTPSEQPLHQDVTGANAEKVRKTGRHQAATGKRKEAPDLRERAAMLAILKTSVVLVTLLIVFFALAKGISLYENSIVMKNEEVAAQASSPLLKQASLQQEFDVESRDAREMFAERVGVWREAHRLVRSADALLHRKNVDEAISQCLAALEVDSAHMGAWERLGNLYYQKRMYAEAINAFVRVLSVDPSRTDFQKQLIEVLAAYGDSSAVVYMTSWYLKENEYDSTIQQYFAKALFTLGRFDEAIEAYKRVLKDSVNDYVSIEKLAESYMALGDYSIALSYLSQLSESNYRDPVYYHNLAVCNAQVGNALETVQVLGKAAHLFGQDVAIDWVQDPLLDPVRTERIFQSFTDRVGGAEFRRWLEKIANNIDVKDRGEVVPQLELPGAAEKGSGLIESERRRP